MSPLGTPSNFRQLSDWSPAALAAFVVTIGEPGEMSDIADIIVDHHVGGKELALAFTVPTTTVRSSSLPRYPFLHLSRSFLLFLFSTSRNDRETSDRISSACAL